MDEISQDYEEMADTAIDDMIARFEPTIVAVLAVSVDLSFCPSCFLWWAY